MFLGDNPDFEISAKDVKKFLAFVRIGLSAAATRFDAEKVRFHHRLPPGKQLHANVRCRLEDFSLMRPHQARIIAGGFEERENVGAIETGDAPQGSDRGAHLAALQSAEKTDGDSSGASHLCERESAARAQTAEALPGMWRSLCRIRDNSLPLEHVNDGGGIKAARAAQKNRSLQQAHIGFPIEAIPALVAPGVNQDH